jgi:DNA segregation ATPase FtsK/SpoIIIE-like protein
VPQSAGHEREVVHQLVAHPRPTAVVLVAAFAATIAALYLYWPVGVVLGLFVSLLAVNVMGRRMADAANSAPHDGRLEIEPEDELGLEVRRLRSALGDDFSDFARAADAAVSAQRASTSALQKKLTVSQARARYLLGLLERERFVGPHAGNRPRDVLVPAEHLENLRWAFGLAA